MHNAIKPLGLKSEHWLRVNAATQQPHIQRMMCSGIVHMFSRENSDRKIWLCLTLMFVLCMQQEALALLCSMADFSFYRPAIRKAEPADMVAHMLQAGCSQVRDYCCYF